MHRWERIARHIASSTGFGAQIAIEPGDLPGRNGRARQPSAGETLKDVIVDAAHLLLGRNGLGGLRVEDHEIGVGANSNRALAWIDIENAAILADVTATNSCLVMRPVLTPAV